MGAPGAGATRANQAGVIGFPSGPRLNVNLRELRDRAPHVRAFDRMDRGADQRVEKKLQALGT
jgi:hypothetical protein